MNIFSRPLNKGETYCCSLKKVKEVFYGTNVNIDFGFGGRDFGYLLGSPLATYCNKHIFGRVIASMETHAGIKVANIGFCVLKEKDFHKELKSEFEEKILPQYLKIFNEVSNLNSTTLRHVFVLTELYQGKLINHEAKLK